MTPTHDKESGPAERFPVLAEALNATRLILSVPTGDPVCNPSVLSLGESLLVVMRSHNYRLSADGLNTCVYGETIQSVNWTMELGRDGQPSNISRVDDSLIRCAYDGNLAPDGLEDCRLLKTSSGVFFVGSGRRDSGNLNTMCMARWANNRLSAPIALLSPYHAQREKNWMPIEETGGTLFIYRVHPFVVIRATEGRTVVEWSDVGDPRLRGFSGSSQAIRFGGNWLFVVHKRISTESARYYVHRLVEINRSWELVRLSPEFFFERPGIEFCGGIASREQQIIFSYGVHDERAMIMSLDQAQVDWLLS